MQLILSIRRHGKGASVTTLSEPDFVRWRFCSNTLAKAVRDILAGSRDGLAMQDRYQKLSRLSDWELARRGLTRADIIRLVVHGKH